VGDPDGPLPYEAPNGAHWRWIRNPGGLSGRWVLFPPDDPPYPTSGPPSPRVVNSVSAATLGLAAKGTDIPIVYGERILDGAVIYQNLGNPSLYVVVFASGPVHAVPTLHLNGVAVASGVDGVTYTVHLGAYNQSVDTTIGTYIGNYNLPGICYAVVSIDGGDSFTPPSPWYGNVSVFSATVQGIETYDPRENRITNSESFSNTYWSGSPAFPTLVTGVADRFGGTAASRWTFGGAGPYVISRQTSGLSLVSGDPVCVVLEYRTTSGTVAFNLTAAKTSGTTTSVALTATTSWRRRAVVLTSGGTGNAQIQLGGIPSSAVLEVAFASVQILSEDYGYTKTVASAITAGTRYGTDPILALRDLMTDAVHGGGLSTSFMNDASAGKAAALCDAIRADGTATYSLNLAITTKGTLASYMEAIRATCALEVFMDQGKYCFWVDDIQPIDAVLSFTEGTDAKNVRASLVSSFDRPTRVVVEYQDASHSYAQSTAVAEHAGLATGAVELKEARYQLDGVTSQQCALRAAEYLVNISRVCELRTTFTVPFKGVLLYRGMLIALTTLAGLSAQALVVTDFSRLDTGEYQVTAREYDTALYTFSTATPNTPVASNLPNIKDPPPPIVAIATVAGSGMFDPHIFWHPPVTYAADVMYGASYWSAVSPGSFTAASVNDGNTAATAFAFSSFSSSALKFDAGAGAAKRFGKCKIYTSYVSGTVSPRVDYSDDDVTYTTVAPDFYNILSSNHMDDYGNVDFNTDGSTWIELDWGDVGAHRYWRIRKESFPALYTFQEIQFSVVQALYPPAWIAGYEVHSGPSATSPIVAFLPGGLVPTKDTPLDVSSWITQTPGAGLSSLQFEITIVVKSIMSQPSAGRTIKRATNAYYAGATSADTIAPYVMQRTSVGGAAQSGNYDISGVARSGSIGRSGGTAAFILPATDGTAGDPFTTDGAGNVVFGTYGAKPLASTATNGEAGAIVIGAPVYLFSGGTVKKAKADAAGTANVLGLVATVSIAAAGSGQVWTSGKVTATTGQWDAVTGGSGGLVAGTTYYLDPATAGRLTSTAPTTAGQLVVSVGTAMSTTELLLRVEPAILL